MANKTATQTQQQSKAATPAVSRKPVHELRLGRLKAAIWENPTDNGVRYNVTFARLYKDDSGWHSNDSFGLDDLRLPFVHVPESAGLKGVRRTR